MTDPIQKTLTVPLTPDQAFDLFTTKIADWWPVETHSLSASRQKTVPQKVWIEPRLGGQVLETCADGETCPWGDITHWEPGKRLVLSWYVGRTPDHATIIDVRFNQSDQGTRVDLTHSGFDVLAGEADAVSAGYDTGWDLVLGECFGKAASKAA